VLWNYTAAFLVTDTLAILASRTNREPLPPVQDWQRP
jgi:hypothetical protein